MPDYNPDIDYYEILQVHPTAHQEVIKRAYRTVIGLLQAHPDLGGSHEDAVRVNEAYRVLSNPELRKAYDNERKMQAVAAHARSAARPQHPADHHAARSAMPSAPAEARRHSAPQSMQAVTCARCGARNRVPLAMKPQQQVICGKCHAPLLRARTLQRTKTELIGDLKIAPPLQERLVAQGGVRLRRLQAPSDRHLVCLRCRYEWEARDAKSLPECCPRCRSPHWSDFRLFHCSHCGHQFTTTHLTNWPYWLFPECPSCHHSHWHQACEKHPLRWVFNLLTRKP